jgi:hypothetical protein
MENLVNFSACPSVDEVKHFCFGGHALARYAGKTATPVLRRRKRQ